MKAVGRKCPSVRLFKTPIVISRNYATKFAKNDLIFTFMWEGCLLRNS
jgi:hypothetical protein